MILESRLIFCCEWWKHYLIKTVDIRVTFREDKLENSSLLKWEYKGENGPILFISWGWGSRIVEIDPDGQNWCRCFKEKIINSLFFFKPAKINDDTSFKFHLQYFKETMYNRFIVEWILFNSSHHEKGTAKKNYMV